LKKRKGEWGTFLLNDNDNNDGNLVPQWHACGCCKNTIRKNISPPLVNDGNDNGFKEWEMRVQVRLVWDQALCQNATFMFGTLYKYVLNLVIWVKVSYLVNNDYDYRTMYNMTNYFKSYT
jgi:hypothetical protein